MKPIFVPVTRILEKEVTMRSNWKRYFFLFALVCVTAMLGCGEGAEKPRPTLTVVKSPIATTHNQPTEKPEEVAKCDPYETGADAIQHDLKVKFNPSEHFVEGSDIITFDGKGSEKQPILLVLAKTVKVLNVTDERTKTPITYKILPLQKYTEFYYAIAFYFQTGSSAKPTVEINFFGTVFDDIKKANNLRFLVGNFTSGIISTEGIYLNKGSGWHPDTWGSMSKYRIEMTCPSQYSMIAPGSMLKRDKNEKTTVTSYENLLEADRLDVVDGVYSISSKTFD